MNTSLGLDSAMRAFLVESIVRAIRFKYVRSHVLRNSLKVRAGWYKEKLEAVFDALVCEHQGKPYEGVDSDAVHVRDEVVMNIATIAHLSQPLSSSSWQNNPGPRYYSALGLFLIPVGGNVVPNIFSPGTFPYLHELIGEMSEDILHASYNGEELREMWRNGTLNDHIAEALAHTTGETPLLNWKIADGDYESYITYHAGLFNGWPTHWSYCLQDMGKLTDKERELVDAFDADAYITKLADAVKDDVLNNVYENPPEIKTEKFHIKKGQQE